MPISGRNSSNIAVKLLSRLPNTERTEVTDVTPLTWCCLFFRAFFFAFVEFLCHLNLIFTLVIAVFIFHFSTSRFFFFSRKEIFFPLFFRQQLLRLMSFECKFNFIALLFLIRFLSEILYIGWLPTIVYSLWVDVVNLFFFFLVFYILSPFNGFGLADILRWNLSVILYKWHDKNLFKETLLRIW